MADKISLLIVDDDEQAREGVSNLLRIEFGDQVDVVGFAGNGADAIEQARALTPDLILMDVNMPGMNGIEATNQITQLMPNVGVIMLTAQDDSQYVKQAFHARAVDYVTKPVNPAELTGAISRFMASFGTAAARPATPQPPVVQAAPLVNGHLIGVLGFKGGTGKTTLAANLAVGLAKARKKVVLVDSDVLFGDVSITLNTRAQHSIMQMADMAADPDQMELDTVNAILVLHESGAKLLLAPSNPSESEPISSTVMTNLLEFLKQHFDYVVVDTSHALDETLLATVRTADRLLVVANATMSSLKDTRLLFAELDSLEAMGKVTLALNQVDRSNTITPDQIANHLRVPIAAQIPFDLTAVNALNSGVALITLDPKRAPSVKPLIDMVQVLVSQCESAGEPA